MTPLKDLTGKTFGRLFVIERTTSKTKKAMWLCKCICGTVKPVRSEDLIQGHSRSCGCYREEVRKRSAGKVHKHNIKPESAINRILYTYKWNARNRGYAFELSFSELECLISKDCHYCGAAPSNTSTQESGRVTKYNGVDRLDSSIGYNVGNCVTACITCNWMKKNASVRDFISNIRAIAEHTKDMQWT